MSTYDRGGLLATKDGMAQLIHMFTSLHTDHACVCRALYKRKYSRSKWVMCWRRNNY